MGIRGPKRPLEAGVSRSPDTTARLDALLDATQTGEWEWNFTTGEISWSPTLGPLHGKPRGWAPAGYEEWRSLIHPDDLPALDEAAQRARATGAGYELEFRAVVPDGSIRWLWTRAEVARNGDERLVGVTRDVTDRRRRGDTERFIARASQVLLATTSADAALQQLCELAVAEVADWCLVQQVSEAHPAAVLAVAHRDPALAPGLRAAHEGDRLGGAADEPRASVISTRTTTRAVVPEAGTELIAPVLSAGGSVAALLVLGNAPSSRSLDEYDEALAEALGRRTAVALERLRLLEAERGAARRTEALQRVGALLSAAATAEDVLHVAIDVGLATIGASGGSIAYPRRGAPAMLRVTAGYSPLDAAGTWQTVPLDADLPGPQAARTGSSVWLSDRGDAERQFPLLTEVFSETPWDSLCALPLAVGVRRGFFVAFFDHAQEFGPDDRAFTEAIVTLCAQALERARLLDEASHARDVARRLQALTAALSAAATPDDVCATVLSAGREAIGADGLLVYLREGTDARLVASVGYDGEVSADWTTIHADAPVPVVDVLGTGDTIVFSSPDDAKRRYPVLANIPEPHGARPSVLVPMAVGTATTGVLCTGFAPGHEVDDDDVVFVQAVGRLCAQALDRARLLEAERVTSERLERLQAVTALLGSAMTLDEVARIVVHEGVAAVGAAAGALVLARDDGTLETVGAVGYSDEVLDLYRRFAPTDEVVAARVYREGRPLWIESLEQMEASYPAHELELDPHLESEAFVPLRLAGGTTGVLMISFEGPRSLGAAERELLLTLGRQCAQAVANARLFERDHRIAEQLQRALLPHSLDVPHRGCVAVRYLSGSAEADVGGDWYDLALRPDGRLGGSVGDVAGKGVLAASRMGQLRTAQRAHSVDGLSPASVVSRINGLVEATDSFFATMVAFDLDQESGELRHCSAGHLPPVLLTADGRCEFLAGGESLPLGVGTETRYEEARTILEPHDIVLFYTDGLVERRGLGIGDALDALCEAVARFHGCDPEELLAGVLADLIGDRALQDDVALLALQRTGS